MMTVFGVVPAAAVSRLAACPWVRPEAVARGRARLLSLPTAEQVATSMLEWAMSGQEA
jgi:hypothetical protein